MVGLVTIKKGYARRTNVAVGTSPTFLVADNNNRKSVTFQNQSGATIYLGDVNVASSGANTGYALAAGTSVTDTATSGPWYGISSATGQLHIIEV